MMSQKHLFGFSISRASCARRSAGLACSAKHARPKSAGPRLLRVRRVRGDFVEAGGSAELSYVKGKDLDDSTFFRRATGRGAPLVGVEEVVFALSSFFEVADETGEDRLHRGVVEPM